MSYIPEQGDIIWIDFSPTAGREQAGHRPAYVISHESFNQFGMAIICPITSQIKGYGTEVLLPDQLKTKGAILTDHLRTLDWKDRKASFKEKTFQSIQLDVYEKINGLILPKWMYN